MQPADDKLSLKGAWSGSCDSFVHFGLHAISLEQMELDISYLVLQIECKEYAIMHVKVLQYGGAFRVT